MLVELGNTHPQNVVTGPDGTETRTDLPGPRVTYVVVNDGDGGRHVGIDRLPDEDDEAFAARDAAHAAAFATGPLATFPEVHDDALFEHPPLVAALAAVPDGPDKKTVRRLLLAAHLAERDDGVTHLPNHEAFVAVAHPRLGAWSLVSAANTKPGWVSCPDNPGLEAFLAEFWDCPQGRPANLEDTHYTEGPGGVYPPGSIAPPDATMLHSSWGRDQQALAQFAFNPSGFLGANGTATASSSTSLTGGTETGSFSHVANDCAGCVITILAGGAGDGGKWAFVKSNTSGTSPVYTVDRWYTFGSPGGSAAATPSSTSTYTITPGGAPHQFVALSTDTTTPSLGGTAGTADAPAATTAMTSEITTAGGGLIRKIWTTMTHTAGAATVVVNTTFTANGTDSLPAVVAKAALCCSAVAGGGGIGYLTLVSPTATASASGDQISTAWTFTET